MRLCLHAKRASGLGVVRWKVKGVRASASFLQKTIQSWKFSEVDQIENAVPFGSVSIIPLCF